MNNFEPGDIVIIEKHPLRPDVIGRSAEVKARAVQRRTLRTASPAAVGACPRGAVVRARRCGRRAPRRCSLVAAQGAACNAERMQNALSGK